MAIDIHRRDDFYNIFWIAWPQALSILIMTIQSMVDMFWIGRLGTESVAAIAICGNLINVIFGLSGILTTGTIALVSRALGAGDEQAASRAFTHSFVLGLFMGVIILALGYLLAPWIIGFFNASPEVTRLAVVYFRVMSIHLMFVFILIGMVSTFAAAGDTFTPLVIHVIAIFVNVVLDPIFIFSQDQAFNIGGWSIHPGIFGWGVFGAGVATNIAVGVAFLLFWLTIPLGRFPIKVPRPGEVVLDLFEFRRIIRIGLPFAIAHISRPLSTVILLRLITGFGSGAVAGFGIAMRWYSVNFILFGGLGAAASVLVGQYLGAASPERASSVSRRLVLASFVIQIFITVFYCCFARDLIAFIDPNPEAVGPGADFMIWVVLGFLLSTPGGMCAAAMNGAGDTMPGMIAGIVSNWAVKLPLAWALALVPALGLDGVWLAMFISLIVEGAMLMIWYKRGKWKEKVLSKDGGAGV